MKTNRTSLLTLVLVVTAAYCGLGLANKAQAQQVVYYYSSAPVPQAVYYSSDPVVYQIQYQRVYQGASWHWSPALGWHTHDHYIDVPHWVPTTRVYPQSASFPATTTYTPGKEREIMRPAALALIPNLCVAAMAAIHCCFVGVIHLAEPLPVPQPQLDVQLQAAITIRIGDSTRCYICVLPDEKCLTMFIRKLPSERFGELPQIVLRGVGNGSRQARAASAPRLGRKTQTRGSNTAGQTSIAR